MDEKELKTSTKQRIVIILIAILMVGSIIASYAAIVISGSQGDTSQSDIDIDEAKVAALQGDYEAALNDYFAAYGNDYDQLIKYKSEVKAYNESSANDNGVQHRDLKSGSGAKVTKDNYLAYYIGFCADESVFDSSLDNFENPTKLKGFIDISKQSLIEGWYTGMEGAKVGGVREITIPGNLAYGDSMEICGGYNKPIKFIVMTVPREGKRAEMADEISDALQKYQFYAQYGVDYDEVMKANGGEAEAETEAGDDTEE